MSAASDAPTAQPDKAPVAPDNEYYSIRAIPGKGYGCFALKPIPRGTRILTDTPLLKVPVADYMKADIEAAFQSLTPQQKEEYFTLHSGHGQSPSDWPSHIYTPASPRATGRGSQNSMPHESSYAYASAERRLQIQELERETQLLRGLRLREGARQPDFVNKLLKMAVALQEEGAWDARLAGVFLDIALVCEVSGDFKIGVLAGEKAVQIKRDCQGVDFPDFKRYAEAVERIKASRRREMGEANGWKA
ncbi:hypothetical protein SLS61_001955 [Didymella pomorum]